MIQIEAIRIRELRGIRELTLEPGRQNFVISGPNGSGKSGVVDAIQFGLTGEISRLAGKGTVGLTVQRHGPHVNRRDDPAAAEVSLTLYIPETGKTAVLTRNVKTLKTFSLTPDDPEIRSVLEDVAQHPELTLSRREIIKYIIVEAGERSREIQALLKLEDIGNIRSVLSTAKNKLSAAHTAAQRTVANANDAFRRHLDAASLSRDQVLAAVNPRRSLLGLSEITELKADTMLNAGVSEGGAQPTFNKQSALRDLAALQEAEAGFQTLGKKEVAGILEGLTTLEADPALLEAITRRGFVERGLALVDGTQCPLCDKDWEDEQHLREHLRSKLARSQNAEALQTRLLAHGAGLANQARRLAGLIGAVHAVGKTDGPDGFAADLSAWSEHLSTTAKSLGTVEQLIDQKDHLEEGWVAAPPSLKTQLEALTETVKAKPDQSAAVSAQTFLALAQDRLTTCRSAQREERQAEAAGEAGRVVYKAYCDAAEEQLSALYDAVESDFSTYYREINADDEGGFRAKFAPSEGKLDLEVEFYDKGMFPPGAYHSEGHQDGMGVCLYLALMKRLLGDRFRFAVLDDVVMSVDRDHRKQFCKLLKARFPGTQFIITTHDKVWAKQMQNAGLVESRAGVVFHGWHVQTGPIFEQASEVWDLVEADVAKNDVEAASARLRRHLEYTAAELADQLGAKPTYRGDFSYDLGDLLPPVIGRQGELLKLAAKAANSWHDADAIRAIGEMKTARADALKNYGGEDWVINKALHYNEWASFSKAEFRDVVAAFKALLLQFSCPKPECGSLLYITPKKGAAEVLRCRCMGVNINLKVK